MKEPAGLRETYAWKRICRPNAFSFQQPQHVIPWYRPAQAAIARPRNARSTCPTLRACMGNARASTSSKRKRVGPLRAGNETLRVFRGCCLGLGKPPEGRTTNVETVGVTLPSVCGGRCFDPSGRTGAGSVTGGPGCARRSGANGCRCCAVGSRRQAGIASRASGPARA